MSFASQQLGVGSFAHADPELAALAAELMRDNPGMRRFEATNRAAALLDDMAEYAARWDANDLPISLIETPAPEGE